MASNRPANNKPLWPSFIKRIRDEAARVLRNNRSKGVMRVRLDIYVDATGDPIAWIIDSASRIEPSRDAKESTDIICGVAIMKNTQREQLT